MLPLEEMLERNERQGFVKGEGVIWVPYEVDGVAD